MLRGTDHMTSAIAGMKLQPMISAVMPARSTPGGSPAPTASPTRTVAAWPGPAAP